MNAKRIITFILLAFVGVSVIYLVVDRSSPAPSAQAGDNAAIMGKPYHVKAYYFHATKRCPTCLEIERLADETVTAKFRDELEAGTLTWDIINYELPGNEHFVDDYELMFSSLVLVKYENGRPLEWKNLEQVWDLVWRPNEFSQYVTDGIRLYLDDPVENNPETGTNP